MDEHILNKAEKVHDINSIKYEGQPTEKEKRWMKKKTPLVTVNWKTLIPAPPLNSSDVTKLDLQVVERMTKNISKKDFDFIIKVDNEVSDMFIPYLKRHGLKYPADVIDKVLDNVYPIWLKLKYLHKRARPFQVASHLGYKISVIQTDSHQTPAYPSGHQAEGAIIAEVLSSYYPEHKAAFYEAAGLVGKARVMQGVHYPSDNDVSMILSRILWEDIRQNL